SIDSQNHGPASVVAATPDGTWWRNVTVPRRGRRPCDNRARMRLDDRFDDLIGSLGGFHRTWLVYLGIELGLCAALRTAGSTGLTIEALAAETGCDVEAV